MIAGILCGSLVSGCGILADGHGGGNRGYHGDDRMNESSSEMFHIGIYHQNHRKSESETIGAERISVDEIQKVQSEDLD